MNFYLVVFAFLAAAGFFAGLFAAFLAAAGFFTGLFFTGVFLACAFVHVYR